MREKGPRSYQAENGKQHCHSVAQARSDQTSSYDRAPGRGISNEKFLVGPAKRSRSGRKETQVNARAAAGANPPKGQTGKRTIRNADVTI
jgi:hypothetical protein